MEKYTLIITPHHKLWHVDFKEIWRYRDLITLFVKRNIIVQYKQTILGPISSKSHFLQDIKQNSWFVY